MTIDDLTADFKHLDRERLLADWSWFLGTRKAPILVTAMGNAFVQDLDTGVIEFLDIGTPDLVAIAEAPDELERELSRQAFVLKFFDVSLASELLKSGPLARGTVFGFRRLPKFGGEYVAENFEPTDIEVHFSLSGQLHEKLAKLPPGQVIGQVTIK
jgi:Domain of unknown function (DUF1851)